MLHGEIEAQQEPARRNATLESEHSVRLGSLTGPSARTPPEGGPRSLAIRVEHCSVEVNPRGEIARWPLGGRRTEPSTSLPLVP